MSRKVLCAQIVIYTKFFYFTFLIFVGDNRYQNNANIDSILPMCVFSDNAKRTSKRG